MPKKTAKKVSDLQIKLASYGPTYLTLEQRREILVKACQERNLNVTSVTPFNNLVKALEGQ